MGLVIGCDVGTQSTKGVAIDSSGTVLATATARYGVAFPGPNWAEQRADDWVDGLTKVLTHLAADLGAAAADVTHLAVDAQVDAVVAVDQALRPLAPATP